MVMSTPRKKLAIIIPIRKSVTWLSTLPPIQMIPLMKSMHISSTYKIQVNFSFVQWIHPPNQINSLCPISCWSERLVTEFMTVWGRHSRRCLAMARDGVVAPLPYFEHCDDDTVWKCTSLQSTIGYYIG